MLLRERRITKIMTPAQLDHLRAIDAHLDDLLALAAKRTPGRFVVDACCCYAESQLDKQGMADEPPIIECSPNNANFIAACAGNAEAGWRATKDTLEFIEGLTQFMESEKAGMAYNTTKITRQHLVNLVLDAWPLESLTPP